MWQQLCRFLDILSLLQTSCFDLLGGWNRKHRYFWPKNVKILVNLLLELEMFELVCLYSFVDHGSRHTELFYKKGFVKIFAKFTVKHLCWNLFFEKNWPREEKMWKALAQVFSREFCEIYHNTNFEECLRRAAMTTRFYGGEPL